MGRIILGTILLIFLAVNGYALAQAAIYPSQYNLDRASAPQITQVYTTTLAKAAIPIGGILADMLFVMILNFMDVGFRDRKRKKARGKQ